MNPGSALYPAKGTLHADMGVYGGPGSMSMPDVITRITNFNDITGDMEINVYPNPAISKVSIEIIHSSLSPLLIEIYDSNSTMVQRIDEKNTNNDGSLIETDISGLSSGMYFIKVRTENKIKVQKFVKL